MRKFVFFLAVCFSVFLVGCEADDVLNLETEMATLQEEINILKGELSSIEDYDDSVLNDDVSSLQDEIVLLEQEIAGLESQLLDLENELSLIEDVNQFIGPVFLDVPPNQLIEYGSDLDLLSLGLTAFDVQDEELTPVISVDVTDTSTLHIGTHSITFSVTDNDGNTTYEVINLEVTLTESDYRYIIINQTEMKITGYNPVTADVLSIPAEIGGLPVTIIANQE